VAALDVATAPGTAEFPIEWLDPDDPDVSWERDDMHAPFAMTPLSADYVRVLALGFAAGYEYLGIPAEMRCRVWNGYVYFGRRSTAPDSDRASVSEHADRRAREHERIAASYWRDEALPELDAIYRSIAELPVEEMEAAAIADAWDPAWDRLARAWSIHFYTIIGPYQVLEDLADFVESTLEGVTTAEALQLVQGRIDELQDVDRRIDELVSMAAASPALADRLSHEPTPTVADLEALPGATAFAARLRAFLELHGHLGQGFDDLGLASWGEEPELLLAELAKRLRDDGASRGRHDRTAAEAAEVEARIREQLRDRPDDLRRFEELVTLGREIGPLTEGHNYWIDRKAQARLRAFAFRVGQRLVDLGVLAERADVLFLERAEVPQLLRAPADRRDVVAHRKVAHERHRSLSVPHNIGKPPDGSPRDRFDGTPRAAAEDGTLRGTGASAGVARGPARVVLGPDDFDRVQSGDIIVAPSSNPSWVPLFTIAAGLVTNTGGVLCHAAVVAREFGLPAVVGVATATTMIRDGESLEIDGREGTVRRL